MKIGVLLEVWRFMRCTAALMALALMAPSIETAIAAQQKNSSKETEDKTEKTEPKKATLRIQVLVVDPEKKQSPVENATVKIQGEDPFYVTDNDGKTETITVLPGAKTVIIQVSSVSCSVDVPVKGGNQDVKVLVEKLPEVTKPCRLQP